MIKVTIIGNGNVASHLTDAFLKASEVSLIQIYARKLSSISQLKSVTTITNSFDDILAADVYIIAVSDDAIGEVSSRIPKNNGLVVHTSGSFDMHTLQCNHRKGVFYPLQSFSKDKKVNFNTIPLCLEAEYEKDMKLLEQLAFAIGEKIYHINSKQRQQLHVSAVFVNNFVNHMYKIGYDICKAYNVPFEVLHPLIAETTAKINTMAPIDAQTGPAKRNDLKTIANHLTLLNTAQQEIYNTITKSIQNG